MNNMNHDCGQSCDTPVENKPEQQHVADTVAVAAPDDQSPALDAGLKAVENADDAVADDTAAGADSSDDTQAGAQDPNAQTGSGTTESADSLSSTTIETTSAEVNSSAVDLTNQPVAANDDGNKSEEGERAA